MLFKFFEQSINKTILLSVRDNEFLGHQSNIYIKKIVTF